MLKTENRFFNISNVKGDMAIYLFIYNFKEYSFSKAGIPLRKKNFRNERYFSCLQLHLYCKLIASDEKNRFR